MKKEETTQKLRSLRKQATETEELRRIFDELNRLMELRITKSKKVSATVDGKAIQWVEESSQGHKVSDKQIRTDILFSIELCLAVLRRKQ